MKSHLLSKSFLALLAAGTMGVAPVVSHNAFAADETTTKQTSSEKDTDKLPDKSESSDSAESSSASSESSKVNDDSQSLTDESADSSNASSSSEAASSSSEEQKPQEDLPETGDNSQAIMAAGFAGILGSLGVMLYAKNKKEQN